MTVGKAAVLSVLGLSVAFLSGCAAANRLHHPDPGLVFAPGEQPDKVLYQKAIHEIAHSRFEVGRLTLQTLINTYPDSEYLSKAKLAIADSYYNEGGVSGFTQAESEYKDFITFFPTAPEAPEAQYRVGMAHFRMMAKADRDQTEALLAEVEFKEFLLKYPDSPLITRVKGRMRQTQEVLGQGDFFTANFYYQHGAYLAARSRFQEIVDKYPNFSGGDGALYYLGQSLEHLRRGREAIPYYSHVITDFPLSPLVPQAKQRLTAMKAPVPHPTRAMLARAQADASHHPNRDWLTQLSGMMSSAPDTSATLFGPVHVGVTGNGIEPAKTPLIAPTTNATVVATPVNEKPAESGKAAPATTTSTTDNGKAKEGTPAKAQTDAAKPAEPAKKKGLFHKLKKVVDPF
jgi:outer membrane protein assembly factor BamD